MSHSFDPVALRLVRVTEKAPPDLTFEGLRASIAPAPLVEVMPAFGAPPMPVSLIYPNRRHVPKRVQAFMDWIDAVLQPYLQAPD